MRNFSISILASSLISCTLAYAGGGGTQSSNDLFSCVSISNSINASVGWAIRYTAVGFEPNGSQTRSGKYTNGIYFLNADDSSSQIGGGAKNKVALKVYMKSPVIEIDRLYSAVIKISTPEGNISEEAVCKGLKKTQANDFNY